MDINLSTVNILQITIPAIITSITTIVVKKIETNVNNVTQSFKYSNTIIGVGLLYVIVQALIISLPLTVFKSSLSSQDAAIDVIRILIILKTLLYISIYIYFGLTVNNKWKYLSVIAIEMILLCAITTTITVPILHNSFLFPEESMLEIFFSKFVQHCFLIQLISMGTGGLVVQLIRER